ncbi:MAG: cobamide remodeling phosphodiesterase CbiR [Candidatus Thorarchaeota archaeon]
MLRFGIVPLELRSVADRLLSDGVLDLSRFDLSTFVAEAVQMEHISVIEITGDVNYIIPDSLNTDVIKKLLAIKDESDVAFTVHLPLWSVEPASINEHIRAASVNTVVETIRVVEPLEPESYVLHATGSLATEFSQLDSSPRIVDLICTLMVSNASRSVEEIIAKSEISPRLLALENIEFPFEFTREIVDEHDTSICFDTGHLLAHYSGTESVLEFYHRHRDRIIEIHLHDGGFEDHDGRVVHRDHIPLGTGELPTRDFLMELVRDDFSGPLIFELTSQQARESLVTISQVVPEALG